MDYSLKVHVLDQSEHALAEGEDASAIGYIKLRFLDGRVNWGAGLDTEHRTSLDYRNHKRNEQAPGLPGLLKVLLSTIGPHFLVGLIFYVRLCITPSCDKYYEGHLWITFEFTNKPFPEQNGHLGQSVDKDIIKWAINKEKWE